MNEVIAEENAGIEVNIVEIKDVSSRNVIIIAQVNDVVVVISSRISVI